MLFINDFIKQKEACFNALANLITIFLYYITLNILIKRKYSKLLHNVRCGVVKNIEVVLNAYANNF